MDKTTWIGQNLAKVYSHPPYLRGDNFFVHQIFRNAGDAELLDIREYLNLELHSRGTTIEVVLRSAKASAKESLPTKLENEIKKKVISDYLHQEYPEMSRSDRNTIADYLLDSDIPDDEATSILSPKKLKRLQMNEELEAKVQEHLEFSHQNEHIIAALKRLQKKEIKVPGYLVFNFNLPLGSDYTIETDSEYGEYPQVYEAI